MRWHSRFRYPMRGGRTGGGWKIRDDERTETPHVTFIYKTRAWRMELRTGEFLDREPPSREVPRELAEWVWSQREELREKWNAMYPENPVFSREEEE